MKRLSRLNPLHHFAAPAVVAVVVGALCIAGGRYMWPLGVVPGLILCVLGGRIAYGHRSEAFFTTMRGVIPWGVGMPERVQRQIGGATVFVFGLFFLAIAATGVAELVS
jgi:hypothetical protein